jgi:ankyrin repeat protein
MAVDAQHEPLVKSLMDAGADINAIDVRWNTPLHIAAQLGHVGLVKTLAAGDAKMEPEVTLLHTPLHTAVLWNKPNCVKALLEAGSDPNPRGCFGQTPLTLACQDGWLDSAKALLEFGADRTLKQGSPRGYVVGNARACARRWNRCAELTKLLDELDGKRNEGLEERTPADPWKLLTTEAWIGKYIVQVYERKGTI